MPFGSGTQARKGDTLLMLLAKRLTFLQNRGGTSATNNWKRNDTRRMIRGKIERSDRGLSGNITF